MRVAVWLADRHRRDKVVRYLERDPLSPRWRLAVTNIRGEAGVAPVDVWVVDPAGVAHLTASPARGLIPRQRTTGEVTGEAAGGLVVLVAGKEDWERVRDAKASVVAVDDPTAYLGKAVEVSVLGGVWRSPRIDDELAAPTPATAGQPAVSLSPIERETLGLLRLGLSNPQIARQRGVALTTVKSCVRSILRKFACANRHELVAMLLTDSLPR